MREKIIKLLNSPSHEDNLIAGCLLKEYTLEKLIELLDLQVGLSKARYFYHRPSKHSYNYISYKLNNNLYLAPAHQIIWFSKAPFQPHREIIEL